MERLRAVVERITYQNETNGYTVLRCQVKREPDLVTCVGAMPEVHVGSVLLLDGEWRMDPKYGRQFSVTRCEETLPATIYGIEKYLGSGLVKGVGPATAKRIVGIFGENTLEVIEHDADRLIEVPGLGKKRAERIRQSWEEQKEIRNIMLFLQGHNVSTAHAAKIYKTYGQESIQVVTENPYRLADDIWGIGFKTADAIAEKLGFAHDRVERLRSGMLFTLNQLADQGHCFAMREQLLESGCTLLEMTREQLLPVLEQMIDSGDVKTELLPNELIPDERAIYLPPFYASEVGVARQLRRIFLHPARIRVGELGLAERISEETGMTYDEIQMKAILTAVSEKVLILTGGPGTGKTTTTLGIITALRTAGANILLAAPTGRAAKRLSEATGIEAKTLHRLLEIKPPEGYARNSENPLEGDVLIVDECSMIDILLMNALLRAVPDSMSLILVGDIDQLPSVGAGNVLRDLIDSRCFPVVRLTRIFRQAQNSQIIMNAHRVNRGQMPELKRTSETDFFFLREEDPEKAAELMVDLVRRRLPGFYHTDPKNIQVLTPMQRGAVGTAQMNTRLQQALNGSAPGMTRGGITYREGDKVMQVRNNYEKGVFNGDIGVVESLSLEDQQLRVRFDDRQVLYEVQDLNELVLAYATTIHKAQGSEYPVVVMPVMMTHYIMLQRNLVYTGITRAKKGLVMVGTEEALRLAIRNMAVRRRNTLLSSRLEQMFGRDPV